MRLRVAVVPGLGLLGVLVLAGALLAAARSGAASGASPARAAEAPTCARPAVGDHWLTVEPGRAQVLVHVPRSGVHRSTPVIVVLGGAGMSGADMAGYTGYNRLADLKGFIAAYPTASGTRPFWNVSGRMSGKPDDVAYLRHLIAVLTGASFCGDPARVGITGVSNGGGMSALMACRAADVLAAAAPVAGGYSTLPDCRPQRALPLLEIHGMRDEVVPYWGRGDDRAGAVAPYLSGWRSRDGCTRPARRSTPARRVQELRWACRDGRVIVHDRVLDAPHSWPGGPSLRPFSSTLRTWRFLTAFRNDRD